MATDKAELRGLAPLSLVQALDALAQAEVLDRNEFVNKVLHDFVLRECRRINVAQRMLRGNPYVSDTHGRVAE